MKKEVYICFDMADEAIASSIISVLEENGISYLSSGSGVADDGSTVSDDELIGSCRIFIVVCSQSSDSSAQVISEVRSAVSLGKTVIPFVLSSDVPTGVMDYYLSTIHRQNAYGMPTEEALVQLLSRIQSILDEPEPAQKEPSGEETPPPASPSFSGTVTKIKRISHKGWLIVSTLALLGLTAFFSYFVFFRQSFRNMDFPSETGLILALLTIIIFRSLRVFREPRIRHPRLLCTAICGVLILIGMLIGSMFSRHKPSITLPTDADPITSMNAANESFAAVSADGTVYYCDSPDGTPGIYRCPEDDFIDGSRGELVLGGIDADNLCFLENGDLVFRDKGKLPYAMKVLDTKTGKVTKIKSLTSSHYITVGDFIIYQEEGNVYHNLAVITPDGKYDGDIVIYATNYPFRVDNTIFYVQGGAYLTSYVYRTYQARMVTNLFIVYGDYIYYRGRTGGLFRVFREGLKYDERLSDGTPSGLIAYGGYLYFLDADNYGFLCRVPMKGGSTEILSSEGYLSLCLIRDCLCLRSPDGTVTRLSIGGETSQ